MFIDIHTHAYHPKIADKVLAQLEEHYGIPAVGTGQIDDLLARAKRAGLDRVVVHNAATAPAQVVPANNWAIRIHRENPEVIAFGTLHPDYPDFEREIERLWRSGIKGIKFHPDFQGFRLDDRKLWPIFEALSGRFTVMMAPMPLARSPRASRLVLRLSDRVRTSLMARLTASVARSPSPAPSRAAPALSAAWAAFLATSSTVALSSSMPPAAGGIFLFNPCSLSPHSA